MNISFWELKEKAKTSLKVYALQIIQDKRVRKWLICDYYSAPLNTSPSLESEVMRRTSELSVSLLSASIYYSVANKVLLSSKVCVKTSLFWTESITNFSVC